jgi:ribonuclease HI
MVETSRNCFSHVSNDRLVDRYIKWNSNNHSCAILNVDGSCPDSPVRSGFGGIIRNLAGFSCSIQGSSDILLAELYAIYKGLSLAKNINIDELVCYSVSLHCVNFIKGPQVRYHINVVLIQDINELLSQTNVYFYHTLRERNQCADFFAKFGASLDASFLTHVSPPEGVRDLLMNDAMGTFFLRE